MPDIYSVLREGANPDQSFVNRMIDILTIRASIKSRVWLQFSLDFCDKIG